MTDSLKISEYDGILEVMVDRPKANAIDNATSRAMGETFARFRDDPDLRVAIVTGGGEKFFSAGWDLKEAAAGNAEYEDDYGVGGFGGLQELPGLNKPVIGAINGMAVGGGFEIALCCDILIAADHARFALPEINVGVLADGASIKLPKRIPYHIAMDMLLTGRWMETDEAKHWGLINEAVPAEGLLPRAREIARLLADGPPLVFACIKEVARETATLKTQESFDLLKSHKLPAYVAMLESEDAKEGPRAFAEKRKPNWKGR
ncbi:MAG: carnitinyl-CoA dehydratase [Marivibrio sp.]|uniref:carnitinyl-CoA dehydratase n=1 Tax=Marivibrio sp. TaxID=2039719 RepID=UPI0032F015E3